MIQKAFTISFLVFFLGQDEFNLFAQDLSIWKGMKASQKIDAVVIDDFEQKIPWTFVHRTAIPQTLRFIHENPGLDKGLSTKKMESIRRLFAEDVDNARSSAGIHNRIIPGDSKYSMEMQFMVEKPGIDFAHLEIPATLRREFGGRPMSVSCWVYSTGVTGYVYIMFSSRSGEKFKVPLGRVEHQGWKRIEADIPPYLQQKLYSRLFGHQFIVQGIYLLSDPEAEIGYKSVAFDLLQVLVDQSMSADPGRRLNESLK